MERTTITTGRRLVAAIVTALALAGCSGLPSPADSAVPVATPDLTPVTKPALTPIPGASEAAMPASFVAQAVTFADARHGWAAGTTGGEAAMVLETTDGGATWVASRVGDWVAIDVAHAGGVAWASATCPEDEPGCRPALVRADGAGGWVEAASIAPLAIAFDGDTGILAAVVPGGPRQSSGMPIAQVSVTTDAGATWEAAENPCGPMDLADVAAVGVEVLAMCTGEGATGGQKKDLAVSGDLGATWTVRATTDDGSLPIMGTKIGIDLASDGTGFLWGARTPVYATRDGGRTWTALDVADGETRMAGAGAAIEGGAGYLVVGTQLLWTVDGTTWEQRMEWPDPPCCGG